jgi:hypothetical protein
MLALKKCYATSETTLSSALLCVVVGVRCRCRCRCRNLSAQKLKENGPIFTEILKFQSGKLIINQIPVFHMLMLYRDKYESGIQLIMKSPFLK